MDLDVDQTTSLRDGHMLYLHGSSSSAIPLRIPSASRENSLTVRCIRPDPSAEHSSLTQIRCTKRTSLSPLFSVQQQTPPTNAVSRRNARERKRVRLVNLGFATLRDHVPSSAKNKKLSKVETLRSAIDYIKQLQDLLAENSEQGLYVEDVRDLYDLQEVKSEENYVVSQAMVFHEDSSEERGASMITPSGSDGAFSSSPASSLVSECSTASPYTSHTTDEFMDIGSWFS